MDINELNSFKLSDAVKFHDKLNPRLWIDKKLDPEVRKQLLMIAEDFMSSLGIGELDIVDITVSGSNAAYSYTPHSDLDLHIVVNIPKLNDTVYRELFTAKKTLYNDSHDITIHGVPVEVYIQDANEPVNSLGEYSVTDDKWIHIPKKKRANFDEHATRAKYENLRDVVDLALKSDDIDRIQKTIDTLRRYRKAGLHKKGEFSPENLAYKAIRSQGGIDALYDKRDQLRGERLSIEEATSREDALLKIKKLSNTTGRTQAEVDTVNRIINKLMKQYNISPAEADFHPKLGYELSDDDPLKAKMASAAYQKAQAAQGFKDELDKIKAKFKNFFAEDQQLDETVEENQIINLISTKIAEKAIDYLSKPGREPQLAGIRPTEFTARQLNLPTIKDPVIADAISRLVIQIGLSSKDVAAMYNGSIDKPIIAINMRIMFSEPNKFNLPPSVHITHTIANSVAHEIQHLIDAVKSGKKAIKYPKNYDRNSIEQYLNLTFEINARLQQAFHECYSIVTKAKKKDGTPFSKKDLPMLVKHLFNDHGLTREYIKDQKVYNRLLTRSYKFLEYLLDNPVKINEPTFVKKAMNFILGKPTSGSIHESLGLLDASSVLLQETARENQIITIVSELIAKSALAKLGDRSDEDLASSPIVIHVNKLNLPEIKDTNIAEPLSKLRVFLGYQHNDPERKSAFYQTTPGKPLLAPIIAVNMFYIHKIVYDFKQIPNSANNPLATTKGALANVLSHEIQHMVDDYKSKGKALDKPKNYDKTSIEQYLNLNVEINARLQQALGEVSEVLSNYVKRDDSYWSAKDTPFFLSSVFRKYALSREDIKDSKVYNRIATRTYKFVEDFLANPVKISKPTFVKKAMNFILGKPTSGEIGEDYDPNGPPPGPEFKPTMPAGTVRVDVSDVYDWYKLGQHISDMNSIPADYFGKGPPSTIMAFGSEPEEHKYIRGLEKTGLSTTDIDPVDPNQPKGMKRQKTDPTYNVNEESGYIPSENEPIEEIGFADILDNLRLPNNEIISNSVVSGTIGQKPVRVFKHGRNTLYFFSNDTNILALVLLEGSHLKAIKNFTNEKGMVYSLLNYIVSFEGKRIDIAANEPFTSEGFEWLLRLAKNTHGLRLTTGSGEKVNIDQLKQEWNNARSTKEPGETSLVISEMSGAWKKKLVENETSLMPYRIFEYSDQLSEASGFIYDSRKAKYAPYFTGDNLTEGQKHLNSINGTVPMQVWIAEIETALNDNIITEAIDEDLLFKVQSLEKIAATPKVGKSYIPIPIIVSMNSVYIQDITGSFPAGSSPKFLQLVDKNQNTLVFSSGSEVFRYPQTLKHSSSYATVVVAENADQYEKIRMMVSLYFNQNLLPLQLNEASGYIPGEKEKNDPRFKTALTVDVRPNSIKKNAKAFNWKTSRAGIPPQARTDGKFTEALISYTPDKKFTNIQEEIQHIASTVKDWRIRHNIFEAIASRNIHENIDAQNIRTRVLKSLVSFSSKNLKIGSKYIPVQINILRDSLIFYDVKGNSPPKSIAEFGTLVSMSNDEAKVRIGRQVYRYPIDMSSANMMMITVFLDSIEKYEQFRMMVMLEFEQSLPAAKKTES